MISLVKMSLKLLLRNKVFLFFLLFTPILSSLFFGMMMGEDVGLRDTSDKAVVLELEDCTKKAVYVGDTTACIIKVYDASNSELSEYVLKQMAGKGMFSVCRADVGDMSEEEIDKQAKKDAFDDRAGMIIYLKEGFDEAILSGDLEQGIKLYDVSEDERAELFVTELIELFGRIKQVQNMVGNDVTAILETLAKIEDNLPEKNVVNLVGKESVELTQKQINQSSQIGYVFAFISLGFLFCGVCVAHSVIEEKNNTVFTRAMLTKLSFGEYTAAKFVMALIISLMQTVVLAICLAFIPDLDVGMNFISFLFIIFLQGLIFSTLSFVIGVLIGEVMSSNYAAFAIWVISAMMAGLYFPLENTTKALKTISYFMPQRWFLDASELLLVGDKSAYSMVLCVTAAYLIVIISVGSVGLKIKRYE